MTTDIQKILKLVDKLVDVEEKISKEIKKEKDVKRRKKLQDAVDRRDGAALRDLWFDL